MAFKYLKDIIFNEDATLREVLERFNITAIYTESKGFGMVVDKNHKCIGVITEGDIRRELLAGGVIDSSVKKALNTDFVYANSEDTHHKILRLFDQRVSNLPILNNFGQPIDIYRISYFDVSARAEKKIIRAKVPMRVSYSGGGTDMSYYINHQQTAVLSSTISKFCTVSILVNSDDKIRIISKDLGLEYQASSIDNIEYGDKLDLIKSAIKIMKPNFGFDLETYSEAEPGTGLGGSSALTVAVIGVLNSFRNENQLDYYNIADLAYQAERIDQRIEGGWQDQYATTFGGFNWMEFRQSEIIISPLRIRRDIELELKHNLMMFRFGETRDSGSIQSDNGNVFTKLKESKLRAYAKMTALAIEMKEALLRGNVKKFGDLLHASWQLKKSFGSKISNSVVDDLYATARKEGSLGGKVLGAGGSGYLLVYASPLYNEAIKGALAEKGAMYEPFEFTDRGLEVWSTTR